MKNWKEDLFNKNDYNWTDTQFNNWKTDFRKSVPHIEGGMRTYRQEVKSISNIMYAHRMDKLKAKKLYPIEQSKIANQLWNDHMKRINVRAIKIIRNEI